MALPDLIVPPHEQAPAAEVGAAPQLPRRKILSHADMDQWTQSEAYRNIEHFIVRLREASTAESDPSAASPVLRRINELLKGFAKELDGAASPMSPGRAFPAWLRKVEQSAQALQVEILTPEQQNVAAPELEFHLRSAFGSPARLDYGTGHELSFLAYLLILRLIGALTPADEPFVARETFAVYLDLMTRVQKTFKLEAAGKMGIWGLDDQQRLVYHWGASQTRIHPSKRPALLVAPPSSAGVSYLFLSSLLHLHGDPVPAARRTRPTSPDQSPGSTSRDEEDFQGLLRLYKHEVLDRLPVVQHLRFGRVLRWTMPGKDTPLPSSSDDLSDDDLEALNATLDRRVTADGTVAPWALPALSGDARPEEMLERLPSPSLSRTSSSPRAESPTTPRTGSPSRSGSVSGPAPAAYNAGLESPFASPVGRIPMPRRKSRLSFCETSSDGEGGTDQIVDAGSGKNRSAKTGHGAPPDEQAVRDMVRLGNEALVNEGDESPFDFV